MSSVSQGLFQHIHTGPPIFFLAPAPTLLLSSPPHPHHHRHPLHVCPTTRSLLFHNDPQQLTKSATGSSMTSRRTTSALSSVVPASSYISIRRSSLLLLTLSSFALGGFVVNMVTRSVRRVQRYIESRGSNGGRRPTILCLGDSITEGGHSTEYVGWIGRLQEFYSRKTDVYNRGFSGYNSDWILKMLPDLFSRFFKRRPPALVTIWLGANDATMDWCTQHVPLEGFKANLEEMVRFFRRLGRRDRQIAVLLITPPPFHEGDWAAFLKTKPENSPLDRFFDRSKAYGDAVIAVGKAIKCPVVDMHAALEGGKGPDAYRKYLSDGLHLNAAGNKKAFEAIRDAIHLHFPWLDPINLEMQGPGWDTLRSRYLDEGEGGEDEPIPLYMSKSSVLFDTY